MHIPIGVQNMIIEKQTNEDKTHIIIKTGFEEEYIELLKSKEQPREEDFFDN